MKGVPYQFNATLWKHDAAGGWHFVSLPTDLSHEIRSAFQGFEEGWGRLKVQAAIHDMEWATAIWFDSKLNTYLLPIKAAVRQKAALSVDQELPVSIWV